MNIVSKFLKENNISFTDFYKLFRFCHDCEVETEMDSLWYLFYAEQLSNTDINFHKYSTDILTKIFQSEENYEKNILANLSFRENEYQKDLDAGNKLSDKNSFTRTKLKKVDK